MKKQLTKEQIKAINAEYHAITKFESHTMSDLAKKHGMTVDELLDIIDF
jgi:hypothetical protein